MDLDEGVRSAGCGPMRRTQELARSSHISERKLPSVLGVEVLENDHVHHRKRR
jgi:hypothetical protein